MFLKLLVSAIESTLFQGGGGLHFKWCQGEAAGVGNQYNCVVFQLLLAVFVVLFLCPPGDLFLYNTSKPVVKKAYQILHLKFPTYLVAEIRKLSYEESK